MKERLIDENEMTMIIKNVTVDDAGNYTCVARNKFGEVKKNYYLSIQGVEGNIETDNIRNYIYKFISYKVKLIVNFIF